MKKLLLFCGLLGTGCSALRPPSTAQLIAEQQAVEHQVIVRPPGIYDAPSVTRKKNMPLVFVDGRRCNASKVKRLVPNNIDSTSIIKPPVSTAIYGKKGRYGVIVITTKEKGS